MTQETRKLIAEFKDQMQRSGVTIVLLYAYRDPLTEKDVCQITSDAGQQGIRAMLHAFLTLTDDGIHVLARALRDSAAAAVHATGDAINKAAAQGAFVGAAHKVFEELRSHWTLKGWEKDKKSPSA